jgi:ethanolamine ammonia-lyase small subunit
MSSIKKYIVEEDNWQSLKAFTAARIALGRTGSSIPLKETLQFKLAHAHARDAVYSTLNETELINSLEQFNLPIHVLHSKAKDRHEYLQRPDLGRLLTDLSIGHLKDSANGFDIALILADGLSATAINHHAVPLLQLLMPLLLQSNFSLSPINIVHQARVAIGDEIGSILKAKISLVLIGERPGLSSPDSMGAYLTYQPSIGLTDESRNCISNIRTDGLNYHAAALKVFYLIKESLRLKFSGVSLKDEQGLLNQ